MEKRAAEVDLALAPERQWLGNYAGGLAARRVRAGWAVLVRGVAVARFCADHHTAFAVSMTVMLLHLIRFLVCAAVRLGIASLVVIF